MAGNNKYVKLVELIERNDLTIRSGKCYDARSGWSGEHLWIKDTDGTAIYDMSVNGYCFEDSQVEKAITKIENYLNKKNLTTFDAFRKWVEKKKV